MKPTSTPPSAAPGFVLLEGWMIGMLLFPQAMAEVERQPPANDGDVAD